MQNKYGDTHTSVVNEVTTGNLAGALSETMRKERDKINSCPKCGKRYIPDTKSVFFSGAKKGQWDEHTYKGNCRHIPETARIAIG